MNDNPFYRPCVTFKTNLTKIAWDFPYLPAAINAVVLIVILVILSILFMTVGIAAQISTMFYRLIEEAGAQMRTVPAVEKSGYAVAIGIYLLVFIPLWLIQAPFQLLGVIWERFGFYSLVVVGLVVGAFFVDWHSVYQFVASLNEPAKAARTPSSPGTGKPKKQGSHRHWSSRDGQFSAEAEFVSIADGFVTLRKTTDGTTVRVKTDDLSERDVDWLRQPHPE